jgi:hypothetical protein
MAYSQPNPNGSFTRRARDAAMAFLALDPEEWDELMMALDLDGENPEPYSSPPASAGHFVSLPVAQVIRALDALSDGEFAAYSRYVRRERLADHGFDPEFDALAGRLADEPTDYEAEGTEP